jgi:hypothetical protein
VASVSVIGWWQWLPLPWRQWRVVGRVDAGDEVPDRLPRKGVVLVGAPERPTWAAFDCPCRRGHRLMVNLNTERYPAWHVQSLRPLSIQPSIDNITPQQRCHFFMRGGKIVWAGAEPRSRG